MKNIFFLAILIFAFSCGSNDDLNDLTDTNLPLTDYIIAGDSLSDNIYLQTIDPFPDPGMFGISVDLDIDSDGVTDITLSKWRNAGVWWESGAFITNKDTTNIEISYSEDFLTYVNSRIQVINDYNMNSPTDIFDPDYTGCFNATPIPFRDDKWVETFINERIDNDSDWSNKTKVTIRSAQGGTNRCDRYNFNALRDNGGAGGYIGFRKTTDYGIIYGWINNDLTRFATNYIP